MTRLLAAALLYRLKLETPQDRTAALLRAALSGQDDAQKRVALAAIKDRPGPFQDALRFIGARQGSIRCATVSCP